MDSATPVTTQAKKTRTISRTPLTSPYDPLFAQGTLDLNGYDQSLYTYVGRFAQIGATYKF